MADQETVHHIRAELDKVLEKARADHAYGRRLDAHPEATLTEAGLPSQAIPTISQEIHQLVHAGHIQSGAKNDKPCDFGTCILTGCNHWGTWLTGKG